MYPILVQLYPIWIRPRELCRKSFSATAGGQSLPFFTDTLTNSSTSVRLPDEPELASATQRELGQLTDAGILHRVRRGNQVYYQANRKNPIFVELKSILAKTSGIRDILHEAVTSLKDRIKLAFVYGSIARGEEKASSDVDLMVVGERSFSDVVSTLAKIETKLGWEVNPTVYGPREFREKLAAKNHFLSAVAKEKKLFVIGDEREFRRLGQERLARRA